MRIRTEELTMRLIDAELLEEQFGISDADILAKEEIQFAPHCGCRGRDAVQGLSVIQQAENGMV